MKSVSTKENKKLIKTQILGLVTAVLLTHLHIDFVHAKKDKQPRAEKVVLYKIKDDATPEQIKNLNDLVGKHGLTTEKTLVNGKIKKAKAKNLVDLTEEDLAQALEASGAVDFAEPDYLVAPDALPNDPKFTTQWHHTKIQSSLAWDVTVGSPTVKVAVCDTGVYPHADLVDNLLPGINIVDGTSVTTDAGSGHGSLVAGTIGAVGNNSTGVAGVNWNVGILPVRISNTTDGWAYYSDMANCVTWATNQGAKVVNISFQATASSVEFAAKELRSRGGLVFISAGNGTSDLGTTDPYPNLIIVGATDSNDNKASWSNYGAMVDISGPGVGILTTTNSGGYANASGTSFSSPMTAAVAALIYSVNPNLSAAQVERILYDTSEDLGAAGKDALFGHGRINAARAVQLALQVKVNALPVAIASADVVKGVAPLTVNFTGHNSYDPEGVLTSHQWSVNSSNIANTEDTSYTFSAAGKYTVKLLVTDDAGDTAFASVVIDVTSTTTTTTTKPSRGKRK